MTDIADFFERYVSHFLVCYSDKASELGTIFCFKIEGAGDWTIDCQAKPAAVIKGDNGKALVSILMEADTFQRLLQDPKCGPELYFGNKIHLTGKTDLALRLISLTENGRKP